jgi:hypothetical protein
VTAIASLLGMVQEMDAFVAADERAQARYLEYQAAPIGNCEVEGLHFTNAAEYTKGKALELCREFAPLIRSPEFAALVADAERWRGLISCARIRPLGCAGIVTPHDEGHAHLGVELWTHYDTKDVVAPEQDRGVEWLTAFADLARAASARGEK